MRTSLNEIRELEEWLFKKGDLTDRLMTEAKVLSNPEFQEKVKWQTQSYELVTAYGRQKLQEEIRQVEKQLFSSPKYRSFQDRIRSIFKR